MPSRDAGCAGNKAVKNWPHMLLAGHQADSEASCIASHTRQHEMEKKEASAGTICTEATREMHIEKGMNEYYTLIEQVWLSNNDSTTLPR
jgi:hypothetical protein